LLSYRLQEFKIGAVIEAAFFVMEENYQLIIMGSRGLGNIKGLLLGSVSQKVSQLSHCPVLIIK
jgi:nucleotide-binding universal stress UspA family protein